LSEGGVQRLEEGGGAEEGRREGGWRKRGGAEEGRKGGGAEEGRRRV
jgi:hypothetical protein